MKLHSPRHYAKRIPLGAPSLLLPAPVPGTQLARIAGSTLELAALMLHLGMPSAAVRAADAVAS